MKTLAAKTAKKTGQHYSMVVSALRCRLAFTAARAAIYCIRGSRRIRQKMTDMHTVTADVLVKETSFVH